MTGHDVIIEGDIVHKRYARVDRDEPAREWAALTLLHDQAPGLAPRPLAFQADPPLVVMSRIDGEPMEMAATAELTERVVAAYQRLFAVQVPPSTSPRWAHPAAFLRSTAEWLEEQRGRTDLPTVVRRALSAAAGWHASAPLELGEIRDPVLAQGDGKVDNMLWDGVEVRLVDFEASGLGDLSFEVADLAEHISARLRGLRDPESLIAAFSLSRRQAERAEAYRIVLASFWLLMLLPGNPGHHRNPEGSAEIQGRHLFALLER